MYGKHETIEVKRLRMRIAELEQENEVLRKESSEYLSKWIAAQDLASWRQVLVIAQDKLTPLK